MYNFVLTWLINNTGKIEKWEICMNENENSIHQTKKKKQIFKGRSANSNKVEKINNILRALQICVVKSFFFLLLLLTPLLSFKVSQNFLEFCIFFYIVVVVWSPLDIFRMNSIFIFSRRIMMWRWLLSITTIVDLMNGVTVECWHIIQYSADCVDSWIDNFVRCRRTYWKPVCRPYRKRKSSFFLHRHCTILDFMLENQALINCWFRLIVWLLFL